MIKIYFDDIDVIKVNHCAYSDPSPTDFRQPKSNKTQRSGCRKSGEFRCSDGTCIDGSLRCDGFFDCDDATDEIACTYCKSLSSLLIYQLYDVIVSAIFYFLVEKSPLFAKIGVLRLKFVRIWGFKIKICQNLGFLDQNLSEFGV